MTSLRSCSDASSVFFIGEAGRAQQFGDVRRVNSDAAFGAENRRELSIPSSGGIGVFPASFNGAQYRNMTPFGISSIAPFLSATGPIPIESRQYALDIHEIKLFGAPETARGFDFDAKRDEVAAFWLFPPNSIAETGSWFAAAIAIAKERDTTASTSDTARLLARIGMSTADSVALSWSEKAAYLTLASLLGSS